MSERPTTYADPYRPTADDVFGTEAWAPGNRCVISAVICAQTLDGMRPKDSDIVTYDVLGEGGYRESGPYVVTYAEWLDWVEGPGSPSFICNERADYVEDVP